MQISEAARWPEKRSKFSSLRVLEERRFPHSKEARVVHEQGNLVSGWKKRNWNLTAVTHARIRARKPSRWNGERDRELGSVGLEGNVPPESEWLNCFQTKTLQDGTRLALRIGQEGEGHTQSPGNLGWAAAGGSGPWWWLYFSGCIKLGNVWLVPGEYFF